MKKKINCSLRSFFWFLMFTSTLFSYAQTFDRVEKIIGLGILEENNGAAVADFDGDLDLDIFVVAKAKDSNKSNSKSRLFRNNSNGTFTDVTEAAGLSNLLQEDVAENIGIDGFKNGVYWGDYDNDGYPDIFLTHSQKIQLFHNNGNGTFTDVTLQAGITTINNCANTDATWFDANNDGFLDLYVSDWGTCNSNSFYLNNGDGTFTNATQQFFGSLPKKSSFTSTPFDFNNDGWMDLYVSQDFGETNDVFINQTGMGFIEQSSTYNLGNTDDDMGMAIGDYNNDGFFDFYIATINTNPLLTNKGDNTFEDLAQANNVINTEWAWGPIFADFDLDGDEDIFVTNGFKSSNPRQQKNYYLKNLYIEGQNTFTDISTGLRLDDPSTSVTPVAFDYDNDGDLDLFVSNSNKESHFYENKISNSGSSNDTNWFQVVLQGTTSNRDAIGAAVSITTTNSKIHRYNSSITHLSQSLKPLHFGIGSGKEILEVSIKWPSGVTESYTNFEINNSILFIEGGGFQPYAIPEVIKKSGCTDPTSCSYDPEAVIDNGSCEYLASNEISGNRTPALLATEIYTYQNISENSSLNWNVSGGEIINGFNTNSITVKWGLSETGEVSIRETNSECSNRLVTLKLNLSASEISNNHSIARLWNEALLNAIRGDFARPTVHARNLFHTSIALYDSWAIFDDNARTYLIGKTVHNFSSQFSGFKTEEPIEEARKKAMSYAAYRLLSHRFQNAPQTTELQTLFNFIMTELGYNTAIDSTDYTTGDAAALGNFIAKTIIDYGNADGAREVEEYTNAFYTPVNKPLFPTNFGNANLTDPNRWQPLGFNLFVDQSGNTIPGDIPEFLSPEWGSVKPFSLQDDIKQTLTRDQNTYTLFYDPGAPPYLDLNNQNSSSEAYQWGFSLVSIWGAHLDPADNVLWDISPGSIGNINSQSFPKTFEDYPNFYNLIEGGAIGKGHNINPYTNQPYEVQMVPRADYSRVLAEFWADGPDSETPPGHWFTLLNYVSDQDLLEKKLAGTGDVLTALEWDVKSYFIMGGAMHDAALSAWSVKGWYDYIRPISAIRYMASLGQSSDMSRTNYHVAGIPLRDGYIEVVEAGDPLEGRNQENIGKIKVYSWKGPEFIDDPDKDIAGVGWILAENWWPYQRPSFVTPPFAGYVSGHSTFSRAAAEVLTLFTGDAYFPGGFGEFIARKNEFLVFEEGPSVDVKLQWATYRDASDQSSLSRIWGGIHPPADDIPGRLIGEQVGQQAFNFGIEYFNGKQNEETLIDQGLGNIVFPNPIRSEVISVANTQETDRFILSDMSGRAIPLLAKQFTASTSITELKFPTNLGSGVYILRINDNSKLILKK